MAICLSALTVLAIVPVPKEIVPERIAGAKPRNVVFILADDHRYDAMSFLGHQFARTPVMDSIAANLRRTLRWDPAKEQFLNDAEANALLDRPMRPPWKL